MRRRLLVGLVVLVAGGTMSLPGTAFAATVSQEVTYRKITFPVDGPTSYGNTWMASRDNGARQHEGTDVMGKKLEVLVAAHDGTVSWTRTDGNNMLAIRDDDGWEYWYIHINNDTPGTDDGANLPAFMFFPGVDRGTQVTAGQPIAYMGDSGNAEGTSPHLHFEIHQPGGIVVNSYWSLMLSQGRRVNDRCRFDDNPAPLGTKTSGGFWTLADDGGVYSYGGAPFHGSMAGQRLNRTIISLTPTSTGNGYWELAGDGGIFSFGDAVFHGSTGGLRLNQPVVGMAATPSGAGYWLVARDGGIFSFGDAGFFGSTGGMRLNQPIVGMAATPSGAGYWLVAADGGVFTFGDAPFLGSSGGAVRTPVVDIAPSPSGGGYWMLTRGGGILRFGDAGFAGSVDWLGYCTVPSAVKLAPTSTGQGYWVQTVDGNTFAFGDAPDVGSVKRSGLATRPIVALAAS
jgi:murein DD-endopeptidase MepM/ murein hydrolase activator NlpD